MVFQISSNINIIGLCLFIMNYPYKRYKIYRCTCYPPLYQSLQYQYLICQLHNGKTWSWHRSKPKFIIQVSSAILS
jgi:hypothetical protein